MYLFKYFIYILHSAAMQVYEDLDASTNPSTHIAAHPVPRDTPWEPRASDMSMDESFDGDEEDIDEEAPIEETLPT